ncbi:sulfatase-like hydrolase/transferase [Reichenbachiella agarivorans]|uniref:Sulfatase-like hydrolase/transferase n=1 Tax=Reichenbachiella agarivorans TaxID=2979464 RepID=A0ABY6CNF4_9BACT|nr:sulfatase-like hydrolase/transferase [Reichenbachiella agarivorans]UXP32045.1 sulfatase-like hydrolase/transferase [Reichenbachiella agarivorans]
MKGKSIILSISLLVACHSMLAVANGDKHASQQKEPNVLVIYTDDHRYSGVHALGGMAVQTPHMDQLAHEGVVFDRAYLMGAFSGATCVPSRAMLLTGRQLFTLQGQGHEIPESHTTMGQTFGEAGYETYMVGKWHQDNASLARSFDGGATVMGRGVYLTDHFRMPLWDWQPDGNYTRDNAYLLTYDEAGQEIRRPLTKDDKKCPTGTEADGPHTSEIFAREAVKYIASRRSRKPWMMYLAFHAPHDPRQAPKAYRDMYPPETVALTPSYMPQHPFDNGHIFLRDEALAPWPRTETIARQQLADYYAIITHLDTQIGRVIQALKESGQYNNTLIVLAGDSGLGVGNHGLLGKQNIYDEDGVHIPLIFSGGAISQKGKRTDALCYTHDIFPTICDLVGIDQPASANGQSMAPVIAGDTAQIRDYTYHAYRQHQRAYREGDYKLIEYVRAPDETKKEGVFEAGSRVTQLFNVVQDPWEMQDLSPFPEHRERVAVMRKRLKEKAIELGDSKESVSTQFDYWDYYE